MVANKIALIEFNKETAERLAEWCRSEGYEVDIFNKLDPTVILPETLSVLLVNICPAGILDIMGDRGEIKTEVFDSLIRFFSTDPNFFNVHVVLIAPSKAIFALAEGIEAGADNFITEFSDKQVFLENLRKIVSMIKPGAGKTRLLDLNLINFFLTQFSMLGREDFFTLAPVIFNAAVIRRVMPYLGETTISAILTRLEATTGKQAAFMKETRFEGGKIFMDGVDKASKEVSVPLLCSAFRDYIYAFVHLVRALTSDILIERWDWERK